MFEKFLFLKKNELFVYSTALQSNNLRNDKLDHFAIWQVCYSRLFGHFINYTLRQYGNSTNFLNAPRTYIYHVDNTWILIIFNLYFHSSSITLMQKSWLLLGLASARPGGVENWHLWQPHGACAAWFGREFENPLNVLCKFAKERAFECIYCTLWRDYSRNSAICLLFSFLVISLCQE